MRTGKYVKLATIFIGLVTCLSLMYSCKKDEPKGLSVSPSSIVLSKKVHSIDVTIVSDVDWIFRGAGKMYGPNLMTLDFLEVSPCVSSKGKCKVTFSLIPEKIPATSKNLKLIVEDNQGNELKTIVVQYKK